MNNELYHHGILGQKWGVRRYQNSDGSLTKEGKERYGSSFQSSKNENLKIALQVGTLLAVTALASYGAYKCADILDTTDFISQNTMGLNTFNNLLSTTGNTRVSSLPSFEKSAKKLEDFTFERVNRIDSNGLVSSIDLPVDRQGYADTFARQMSKTTGDYDYWYKYIMGRMNHQSSGSTSFSERAKNLNSELRKMSDDYYTKY